MVTLQMCVAGSSITSDFLDGVDSTAVGGGWKEREDGWRAVLVLAVIAQLRFHALLLRLNPVTLLNYQPFSRAACMQSAPTKTSF